MRTTLNPKLKKIREFARTKILYLYIKLIKPTSIDEDRKRQEAIFNIITVSVITLVCLLSISVLYADLTNLDKVGFRLSGFLLFIPIFTGLLVLSRVGKVEVASPIFITIYFVATTYGIYSWGIEVPLALLSYALIITITSVLINTKTSFIVTILIICTIITIGYLETSGLIKTDSSWRNNPSTFKDTLEDSFIYLAIIVISWLSNRDLEKSLIRARRSEKALRDERNLLEIKIEERTKDLKAAQADKTAQLYKFVEFGRISSGVFHDLITPLTTMALTVEQLRLTTNQNPEHLAQIDKALRAVKRIDGFIATTRKQLDTEGTEKVFSVKNEITDAIDLLLHKSRVNNVKIETHLENKVYLYGNYVRFFQIVLNLISNAIDSFANKNTEPAKKVLVTLTKYESYLEFSVVDNGEGIRDEIRSKIFDPFFTTKTKGTGMGLGLSTTKNIIERDFKGKIELKSVSGVGSTFKVTIPL